MKYVILQVSDVLSGVEEGVAKADGLAALALLSIFDEEYCIPILFLRFHFSFKNY
jgi:hypothetical protein